MSFGPRGLLLVFLTTKTNLFMLKKKLNGKHVLKVLEKLITWSSQAFAVTFTAFVQLNEVV